MGWYFAFFLVSGFCGILYELIWMRLAMAQFGVTTALVSIVLSTFMAGLGAGSWAAGGWMRRRGEGPKVAPLRLYALSELLIGFSAIAVPRELAWGHDLLARLAERVPVSSGIYYLVAGGCLALTLVPWCACMGATIPLAMAAIGSDRRYESRRSFSFLYVANVLGAVTGSAIPLFLIEMFGFRGTLHAGAVLNAAIATSAALLSLATGPREPRTILTTSPAAIGSGAGSVPLYLLFMTGLATMGMELIWIRLFTPFVGPLVYSFAMILGTYLLATFLGSRVYRVWSRRHNREGAFVWVSLGLLGLLPLVTTDARVPLPPAWPSLRIVLGISAFSGVIGFLTPMLVDRWSQGDPDRAGRAYAVNVVGCIVGPLISGFILLPWAGEHVSMLLFAAPWIVMGVWPRGWKGRRFQLTAAYATVAASLAVFFLTKDYETRFPERRVLRDATATVIATGTGMNRQLYVNGVGMTFLTPITKMMAHFTLASLDHAPQRALVICFGMGTTFRSALSWGIPVTVVDLVPSVPKMFDYYFADAPQVLSSPMAHVVIDDGRRYLERTDERYDVILIDPPPPVPAVGSSLLYSRDFYALIREHLEPEGILAQWLPHGDNQVLSSVSQALGDSFAYVRVFNSVEQWGWHFLASDRPIPPHTADELLARMPPRAVTDMMEWGPEATPAAQLNSMLSKERSLQALISLSPLTPALSDNRPINEYYRLRKPCNDCPFGTDHIRGAVYSELLRLTNGGPPAAQ
jgi:spermidine synthase